MTSLLDLPTNRNNKQNKKNQAVIIKSQFNHTKHTAVMYKLSSLVPVVNKAKHQLECNGWKNKTQRNENGADLAERT